MAGLLSLLLITKGHSRISIKNKKTFGVYFLLIFMEESLASYAFSQLVISAVVYVTCRSLLLVLSHFSKIVLFTPFQVKTRLSRLIRTTYQRKFWLFLSLHKAILRPVRK